jgi:hypothetical protein
MPLLAQRENRVWILIGSPSAPAGLASTGPSPRGTTLPEALYRCYKREQPKTRQRCGGTESRERHVRCQGGKPTLGRWTAIRVMTQTGSKEVPFSCESLSRWRLRQSIPGFRRTLIGVARVGSAASPILLLFRKRYLVPLVLQKRRSVLGMFFLEVRVVQQFLRQARSDQPIALPFK